VTADIRFGDGITISFGTAARMVSIIGLTEKLLARQNGQALSPDAQSMRDDLRTSLIRAAGLADATKNGVLVEVDLTWEKSPEAAAEILGMKVGSVQAACRAGRFGRKVRGQWLITDQEIEVYRHSYRRGA
jgi:hypothetical protein